MLIKAENISVTRNKKEILKNINIVINQKDFITILGPNGAGKSMLLKCLLGFYKPDNGSIIKSPGLKISYTPQDFTIDKSIPITALDFITLNKKIENKKITEISQEFKIEKILKQQLSTLSGGELQKILIVRSLVDNPNLLILDEPTQNLDVSGQLNFYKFLNQIYNDLLNVQKKNKFIIINYGFKTTKFIKKNIKSENCFWNCRLDCKPIYH